MQNLPAARQSADPAGVLAGAFRTFTEAAGALENSYAQLQGEVGLLRRELEETNRSLAESLADNRRYRSFLTRTLESLPCGVLVLDEAGEVRMANPEARRLLGWVPAEPVTASNLASLMAHSAGSSSQETEWNCGDRTMGVRRAVMPGEQEPSAETIFILRDKTEEVLLGVEREKARRSQALAEMAMVLAHEIRNPLAGLELFAGLLAEGAAPESETDHYARQLLAGIRGLSATVNNVLQFHGDGTIQTAPMDLARLLADTASFLEPLARQRQLSIDCQAGTAECRITADRSRLQQVFLNLALNAFRAMQPGGVLRLRLAPLPEEQRVSIRFEDDGSGIPPELLPRIFGPGFSTSPGSPGLGLAVCRRVIEQHGGRIDVASAAGRGSVFEIRLPLGGTRE
jgi:signal transduction histidine kinase